MDPPNVPIPDVAPMDTNGYCVTDTSIPSETNNTWCNAEVWPYETLTVDLSDEILLESTTTTSTFEDDLTYSDAYTAVCSNPSGWPEYLNL